MLKLLVAAPRSGLRLFWCLRCVELVCSYFSNYCGGVSLGRAFEVLLSLGIFTKADWLKNCSGGLLEGWGVKETRQGLVRLDCPGGRECGCTFSSQPRFCPTCALVPLRKNPPEIRSNCLWSGSSGVFN